MWCLTEYAEILMLITSSFFALHSWLNSTVFSRAEETFFFSQNTGIDKILIQCLTSLVNWSVYQFTAVRKVYSLAAWSCSAFLGTLWNRVCFSMSIRKVTAQIYTSIHFYPSNLEAQLCDYAFHPNKKTHKYLNKLNNKISIFCITS